jgi:hypothetical protein
LLIWPVLTAAEGVGDALVGGVGLAVDAVGVHLQQDDDAMPGAAGDFGRGHAGRTGPPDQAADPAFHRVGAVAVIACLLLAVIVALSIYSDRSDKTAVPQSDVQAVAGHWAAEAGWSVVGVPPRASSSVEATWPGPAPSLAQLRRDLDAADLTGPDVRVR